MKNYLEYKGYIGTVEFSAEDKIFFGKIQGINDLVTFEGASVDELQKSFQESILDYLETCAILNKVPEKVFKGSFNVRVSQELHQKTALLASKKGLNLNDVVKEALNYIVKHEEVLN
ncbi:type II toxin-antitoxin system HicB family antitoxin [Flavobacterium undicola]|uniref:type II toxin-antitoxin system HicB family antitoxin n=1 Tax=Flavobacterium undicola TaxID=1932779 RepID=UPI001377F46C|nr:type II toxin-antitoxin system HicB family antitoxin [Flavobacterium undicola]MBA0885294.1 type II toxin-antitoxin system HicB family antitoxin [Flavobacterium undicola]